MLLLGSIVQFMHTLHSLFRGQLHQLHYITLHFEIHWIPRGFRISDWISGFHVDFWISKWISGFHVDFWISKWISGFHVDFRISKWISTFWILFEELLFVILKILLINKPSQPGCTQNTMSQALHSSPRRTAYRVHNVLAHSLTQAPHMNICIILCMPA